MNLQKEIFKLLRKNEESKLLHFFLNRFSNNGIKLEALKDEDYIFGASPLQKKLLNETAQWQDYKPSYEVQHGKFDTMGCVSFSLLNVLETLAKKQWNEDWNRSDRFTVVDSKTTTNGNSMNRVIDSVRHSGTVSEDEYPWDRAVLTRAEYFQPIPDSIKRIAGEWLNDYEVGYEAVQNHKNSLKEALKYSPLWIAGYAWYRQGDKYYSYGTANHAFMLIGYKENDYWLVFDSYAPHIKLLDWNFNFAYPKLIVLKKKDQNYNLEEIEKLKERGGKYVMRVEAQGQIYELKEGLEYVSPQEWNNRAVKEKAVEKILIPVNEEFFNKLIK